jgi:hypothetical protein
VRRWKKEKKVRKYPTTTKNKKKLKERLYHSLFPKHQSDKTSGNRSFDNTRDLGVQSVEKTNNDQKKHTQNPRKNKKKNKNTSFCLSLLSPSRRQAATERTGDNSGNIGTSHRERRSNPVL